MQVKVQIYACAKYQLLGQMGDGERHAHYPATFPQATPPFYFFCSKKLCYSLGNAFVS